MKHRHAMPFGAELVGAAADGVRFRLWAPGAPSVVLEWSHGAQWHEAPMRPAAGGWHEVLVAQAHAGDLYRYSLPGGLRVPDPASRCNPHDVHGPSQVIDPEAFPWSDDAWTGRPWEEAVIYELHVGAFTPEGSFEAAQRRLADLAALGITAIELMPLADFPGRRNWGYDGVLPFAPDASYGTPEQLKRFVDGAHALGLMVLLDVVYNHFGPEGNYLHAWCSEFFDATRRTPWGAAIAFEGPHARTVRDFFIHNALFWIEEYRFDGLRLDAVHAIHDTSPVPIVEAICEALRQGPGRHRQVHVVLENDRNEAHRLARDNEGRPLVATAQWNDDLHHAAHVLLTGETDGYYEDYAQRPLEMLGLALAQGFVYTGQGSRFRDGEARGEPCEHLPPAAFVSFLQSHDQVGNRAFGERIDTLAPPALLQAARSCVLLSPQTPMLFMGEEYGARTPFLYFCDFGPELAASVTAGRRAEFARFAAFADETRRGRIPDPNSADSFQASKLREAERTQPGHREALEATRALLQLRHAELVPYFRGESRLHRWSIEGDALRVIWCLGGSRAFLHLVANFGTGDADVACPPGRIVHLAPARREAPNHARLLLPPGGVCAAIEEHADA
jgi:maltooligosyltrehalose trehalohydrolase